MKTLKKILGLGRKKKKEQEKVFSSVIDNHSSGDSVSNSEKADDDSWLSSEEEDLGCSPKKPEKTSLAQLMKGARDFLKNLDEKDCAIQTEVLGSSQQNKADCEFEECNESLPKPLFQVKTFPHSIHSSPGSFSKCSQRTLHSKQEKSSKDDERGEQDIANKKSIVCRQSWSLSPKAKSTLGMDKDEEENCTESPWDSECTSESPRKLTVNSLPTSPAKTGIYMHSIMEEPFNGQQYSEHKIIKEFKSKGKSTIRQLQQELADSLKKQSMTEASLEVSTRYRIDLEEDKQQLLKEIERMKCKIQAASQKTLEQIRATNNASLRNQLENKIKELESELAKLKNNQQESIHTELERYKGLYSEERKIRKSLGSKLDRANAKLAEANTQLYHERQKNKSLLANSFLSGSLSSSPVLETVHMGNKSLNLGGGFLNTNGTALASKNRKVFKVLKMRMELEKSIIKELEQAEAEFDAESASLLSRLT